VSAPGPLAGRTAVVTGSTRGVGRACALALAQAGANVVVTGKSVTERERLPGTIQSVAAELEAAAPGVGVLAQRCDVRQPDQIEALVDATLARFGAIDIWVNNAGAAWWHPVEETPARRFDLVMDVNFRGPHEAARLILPHMRAQGSGHIVNMSPPVHRPDMVGGKAAYMVSKFGMTYLAIALAEELAGEPIAVNALWPVTLIESYATINLGLGERAQWRRPEILADALVAMVRQDPSALGSGRAWLDEEALRELEGVEDFSAYACVSGETPLTIPW